MWNISYCVYADSTKCDRPSGFISVEDLANGKCAKVRKCNRNDPQEIRSDHRFERETHISINSSLKMIPDDVTFNIAEYKIPKYIVDVFAYVIINSIPHCIVALPFPSIDMLFPSVQENSTRRKKRYQIQRERFAISQKQWTEHDFILLGQSTAWKSL